MARSLIPLALALSVRGVASASCEPWCNNACADLNGDTSFECGACDSSYICRPGAPGFDSWEERQAAHVQKMGMGQSENPYAPASDLCANPGDCNNHGRLIQKPTAYVEDWTVGSCDLEKIHHSELTREKVMGASAPFIVTGLTDSWTARQAWTKTELLRVHADEPYHLHKDGNQTIGELLAWHGKYHMGHAVYPPNGCYSDPWRPYSPMLFDALVEDYSVPSYFTPMSTFQMGVGSGEGIGVPPENHPSSWFAAISGRKRWVMNPPEAGTGRSGGPGSEPPEVMMRMPGKALCTPTSKPVGALHCDQQEGEVIWVPDWWWHETCGMDAFSIGIGGITYEGCCEDRVRDGANGCLINQGPGATYGIADIAECNGGRKCGTLPI